MPQGHIREEQNLELYRCESLKNCRGKIAVRPAARPVVTLIDVPHVSALSLGGGCGNVALSIATLFDYSGALSKETRRHVRK